MRFSRVALVAALMLFSLPLVSESKNPTDYPMRIHIFYRSEQNHHYNGLSNGSDGEGRADLFAKGEVHGLDFKFDCPSDLPLSVGYETYPARWKKPGQEMVILVPVLGKANSYFTCSFKTNLKTAAYLGVGNNLRTEPSAEYVAWMKEHQYDPEHGKDNPVLPERPTGAYVVIPPGGLTIKPITSSSH